jgi:DNA polymerase-3 subunit gamma/tau
LIRKDPKAALSLLDNIIDGGKDTAVFLNNLIEHFRNLMVAKVTRGDEKLIDLPADICERLVRQSEAFTLEEIVSAFNILANTQEMAKRLESMRIPLEINLVRLAHDKKGAAPPVAKVHPPEQLKIIPAEQSRPAPVEQPRITPVEAPQAISLDEIRGSWKNIIDSLGKVKMSVATYLNEGEPLTVQGELLTVALPRSCSLHKESLEKKENKALIEKTLFEVVRVPVKTQFILSDDVKSNNDHESSAFIKSALDAFNGRVIKEG